MKKVVKVMQTKMNTTITIPKDIVKKLELQKSQELLIEVKEDGSLKITKW